MSINIKRRETDELAHELAALTGESVTEAVTEAIRERLERVKKRRPKGELAADIMRIAREAAPHIRKDFKSTDIAEMLYDEHGLPK